LVFGDYCDERRTRIARTTLLLACRWFSIGGPPYWLVFDRQPLARCAAYSSMLGDHLKTGHTLSVQNRPTDWLKT
jgi:hypothetical protein